MLTRRLHAKPIEILQGSLNSICVAIPFPPQGGGKGNYTEGTAKHRTLSGFLYQRHLGVGDQVTGHMRLIDSTFQLHL